MLHARVVAASAHDAHVSLASRGGLVNHDLPESSTVDVCTALPVEARHGHALRCESLRIYHVPHAAAH